MVHPVQALKIERLGLPVLAASVAAVLLLAIGYSAFAAVGLDDECFASARSGPIAIANELFFTWSGRWLGMMASSAAAQSIDLYSWQYGAAVALSFPLWLAGFYFVARAACDKHRLAAALVMLAVFWTACPAPEDVFYWLTGFIVYAPAFVLSALAILLLVKGSRWAAVPAFLAPSFLELSGIVLVAGLLPFARDRRVWPVLAAALAGTLLTILAPGNMNRYVMGPENPWYRLAFYIVRPYDSPWAYMADARVLAMAAFLAALPKPERAFPWKPVLAVLFAIAIATVAVTVGQNIAPQTRVLSFLFAVTVAAAFVIGMSVQLKAPPALLAAVLASTLLASPSVKRAFHDPLPTYKGAPCLYKVDG